MEGKSLYIHRALIAEVSKPLERMMNNGMSETHVGRAVLEDEDLWTFTRFSHWAYAGFYKAAEFSERAESQAQQETNEKIDEGTAAPSLGVIAPIYSLSIALAVPDTVPLPRRVKKIHAYDNLPNPPISKESLKEAFVKLRFCKAGDERPIWTPRANTKASEDYTNVLLSHTRLYVFAEKYDIGSLKRLTLQNLHQTLAAFTLWPECVDDVVTLLRFAYGHTSKPEGGSEPMRVMLSRYIGYEMDKLVDETPFRDLLEEDRDFLDDFCAHIKKRL